MELYEVLSVLQSLVPEVVLKIDLFNNYQPLMHQTAFVSWASHANYYLFECSRLISTKPDMPSQVTGLLSRGF